MNPLSKIIRLALPAILMTLIAACSSEESELLKRAESEGAAAARELISDMPLSDMDLQNRLLTIRSNEYELRRDGHDDAADAYIAGFIGVITVESDTLTTILGYEKTTD
ncbi:MAG: hypothetical protein K2O00_04050 [Muribaculaceae bacterium]|nr:hypothetical protein [Muribaculaceae bacterium]